MFVHNTVPISIFSKPSLSEKFEALLAEAERLSTSPSSSELQVCGNVEYVCVAVVEWHHI